MSLSNVTTIGSASVPAVIGSTSTMTGSGSAVTVSVTVAVGSAGLGSVVGSAGTVDSGSGSAGSDEGDASPDGEGDDASPEGGSADGEADSDAGEPEGDGSEPAVSVEADQAADGTSSTQKTHQIKHATTFPSSRNVGSISVDVDRLSTLDESLEEQRSDPGDDEHGRTVRAFDTCAIPQHRCGNQCHDSS